MFCFLVFFSLFLVVCCIVFCYIVHLVLAEVDIEPKLWFNTAFGLQAGISFPCGHTCAQFCYNAREGLIIPKEIQCLTSANFDIT